MPEKDENLYCPLMSNAEDGTWYCEKARCAWWADDECAIITIAKGIWKQGRVE